MVSGDFLDQALADRGLSEDDLSPADAAFLRARYGHWHGGPCPGPRVYPVSRQALVGGAFLVLLAALAWFPFANSARGVVAGCLVGLAWGVAHRHVR
jgi:hypothetical protein